MRSNADIIESLPNHIVWYDSEREENCMTDDACILAMDEARKETSIEFFKFNAERLSLERFTGKVIHKYTQLSTEELYELFLKSLEQK